MISAAPITADLFCEVVVQICATFDWAPTSFDREGEHVVAVTLSPDDAFSEVLWILDAAGQCFRCLVIWRHTLSGTQLTEALVFSALVNERLYLGCVELHLQSGNLLFRDGAAITPGTLHDEIGAVTSRVFDLASRYTHVLQKLQAGVSASEALS
ncbi:hypothetical protein [Viridibacterium curvum]|uniref:YbjN domain-containing protein n=1 Tax=Viridibacterium curvum TaxID=1101404 RepID=A0ABP9QUH7_9RHOO